MQSDPQAIPFELHSLSLAHRYQAWMRDLVSPFLGDRIIEVGSGIGNMSRHLPLRQRLVLTEAEPSFISHLKNAALENFAQAQNKSELDPRVLVRLHDLARPIETQFEGEALDTVVSFNVLEHIEDDEAALRGLVNLLQASGKRRIVTVVPAHSWAYGEIDRGFGHFRRYDAKALKRLHQRVAPESRLTLRHFNVAGLPGWVLMGRVLRRKSIGTGAISTFEKICPWVKPVDDFLHQKLRLPLGQSILSVWEWS